MSSIYEYRTIKTAMPKLPPAKPARMVGFSMADLIADAKHCNARLREVTNSTSQHPETGYKPWTPDELAALRAATLAALEAGRISTVELAEAIKDKCPRFTTDRMRDVLTELHKEGIIRKRGKGRSFWSLA